MLIIMKFGGTSVGSIAALKQVTGIVRKAREQGNDVVVVVSAMSGVTDLLLNGARQAEVGDITTGDQARQEPGYVMPAHVADLVGHHRLHLPPG